MFLKKYDEAEEAYKAGLKIDPNSELLKSGLSECRSAVSCVANCDLNHTVNFNHIGFFFLNIFIKKFCLKMI